MPYDPSLADEIKTEVLKPGIYSFETISCKEGETKDGRQKLILTMNIFDEEGCRWENVMHLVLSVSYHVFHLKRYWESVGHPEMFEAMKDFHDEHAFEGKCGKLKTKIQKDTYNGNERDKCVVEYFIKKEDQINKEPEFEIKEDDIQF